MMPSAVDTPWLDVNGLRCRNVEVRVIVAFVQGIAVTDRQLTRQTDN